MPSDQTSARLAAIERDPAKLRAYYGDIERLIARCLEELYLLALKKGCRAALADIEYRARVVLKLRPPQVVEEL